MRFQLRTLILTCLVASVFMGINLIPSKEAPQEEVGSWTGPMELYARQHGHALAYGFPLVWRRDFEAGRRLGIKGKSQTRTIYITDHYPTAIAVNTVMFLELVALTIYVAERHLFARKLND